MKRKFTLLFCSILLISIFIRIYHLTSVPPALHGDELGVGYNAYTLLETGKDEYGRFLPLTFRSDFTPLIFYATVPFIALFGLTEFATRFPTALIGIITVPAVYFLIFELTRQKRLSLLTMCLVALSSWHIRTSRIALELTWALFFQIVAITLFLKSLKTGRNTLIFSFIFFGISIFSYHSTKMTTPLLLVFLLIIYRQRVNDVISIKKLLLLISLCIVLPLLIYIKVQSFSQIRFVGISVFTLWKNSYPTEINLFSFKPLSDLGITILKNYLVHFDPHLLFVDNSNLRYFQLPQLGLFYLWQAPFILVGLFSLIRTARENKPWAKFILYWLLLAPLPAALTTGVPYANIGRVLLLLPVLELMTAYGAVSLAKIIRLKILIIAAGSLSIAYFSNLYFNLMPKTTEVFWGTQWRTAAKLAINIENVVDSIIMTNPAHQSYVYVLYYGQKSPQWLNSQEKVRARDIGFTKIGKYEFRTINWEEDQNLFNSLIIGTPKEIPISNSTTDILSVSGDIILRVIKTP